MTRKLCRPVGVVRKVGELPPRPLWVSNSMGSSIHHISMEFSFQLKKADCPPTRSIMWSGYGHETMSHLGSDIYQSKRPKKQLYCSSKKN